MSSVSSSSGSSGQDESVRNLREEYRKKEAELVKKQNKEVRELNARHTAALDKKDRMHSASMDEVREKGKESITQRDVKYRKEMDEMRNMHSKQLEKLMLDNQQKLDIQRKTAGSEVKQAHLGKEDRIKELHDRYENQLALESKKYHDLATEMHEDQRETLVKTREQLAKEHDKEVTNLLDERNERVAKSNNDYRTLREQTNSRVRNQEIRHMQDKARMADAHMDNIRRESFAHGEIQESTKDGFDESLNILRHRMQAARDRDARNQTEINEDFKEKVDGRIDNQVNRLEQSLEQARGDNIKTRAQNERNKNIQISNIRDAYQTKFDYLEKARQDTLRQSNEINSENINKMRGELDKQAIDTGRYYRQQMEVENFKNRKAIDEMKSDAVIRQNYTEEKAENRIDKIRTDALSTEERGNKNYQANLEILKSASDEEKQELRLHLNKQKDTAVSSIKSNAQKQEVENQRRLDEIVNKYEKRIAEMNDRIVREKRMQENHEKTLVNSLKRQHDTEKEALRIQFEEQNKQSNMARDRELQDANRRHQEKLNDVLNSVKKS